MDSSTWAAMFSGVSATAAIATSAIAGWALSHQRRDSHDRTRPVVSATMRLGPRLSDAILYFVVRNTGGTLARNVRVTFDPPIAHDEQSTTMISVIGERYARPISILAPGDTLTNYYLMFAHDDESAPHQITVTVEYDDDRGRHYGETFHLETETYNVESTGWPSGNEYDKRTAKATEALTWETWARRR